MCLLCTCVREFYRIFFRVQFVAERTIFIVWRRQYNDWVWADVVLGVRWRVMMELQARRTCQTKTLKIWFIDNRKTPNAVEHTVLFYSVRTSRQQWFMKSESADTHKYAPIGYSYLRRNNGTGGGSREF